VIQNTATPSKARHATVTRNPEVITREMLIERLTAAKNEIAQVKAEYEEPVTLYDIEMAVGLVLQDVCRFLELSEAELMRVMGDDYIAID
jgi:hypothetical protein